MPKPLTNVQIEILQSFNYSLSDAELTSFRKMLVDYFSNMISENIDLVFEKNNWGDEKSDEWASTHM